MEINGEVNIEIDQYADVNIELDTEDLAETLCQDHNLVDDVVLHNYVDEHMTGVSEQIDGVVLEVDELRERIRELSPDNNYVRINDLHITIKEVVDARLIELFTRIIKEG
jgi:hypothetical protein